VEYDLLYPASSLWINETVTTTIFGASRECNHLHTNVAYLSVPVPGSMDLYWDKATGATVRGDIILIGGVVWRIQWNATSTSLWSPAPTIDQPTAITYLFGTTGHSITWHPSSNVPCNYTITKDGAEVTSANWNGEAVTCSVDGLALGTYTYTCTVNDTIGRRASSSVTVTVSAPPPTISEPADITYTSGTTGHGITWQCSSLVPKNYTITRNGTVVSSGDWDGQAISCNVDGLEAGTYVYTCTVCDTIGRRVSSTVTVTVSAAQPQPFPVELLIGGIAGIAAVVIVVAVIVLRKRGR
jgi:plastocyanin